MADGDVKTDEEYTFADGRAIRLFAVESSEYPGGVNYRFHYYNRRTGESFLRYDNARVPTHGAGYHHRHEWVDGEESVEETEFVDYATHLSRFQQEVTNYDH